MHNNEILKIQYNQSSCNKTRQLQNGISYPSFKARLPKNAEKQITEDALKIASAAIASSGIAYLVSSRMPLTKEQQEEVIEKYKKGQFTHKLAEEYSCSKSTIINLIKCQPDKKELQELNKKNCSIFPPSVQKDIINMYINGATYEQIAEKYKCNKSTVCKFFGCLPNKKEIRELHFSSLYTFNNDEINEIIGRYTSGESFNTIAKDFECSNKVIQRLIDKQENSEELRKQNKQNRTFLKPAQKKEIIERFANGESGSSLAKEFKCNKKIIQILINEQPNAEELKEQSKLNRHFTPGQKNEIVLMFKNGCSYDVIASEYECSNTVIKRLINEQQDIEKFKEEHEANRQFLPEQRNLIIDKYKSGMSYEAIAKEINSTKDIVRRFIINQPNIEELKELHYKNKILTPKNIISHEQKTQILKKYLAGESCGQIAIEFKYSYDTIRKFIKKQDNAEEIILMHKQNNSLRLQNRENLIIERYKEGTSMELIAKEMDCSINTVSYFIYKRPDLEDIKLEHRINAERFNEEEIQDILKKRINGEAYAQIARAYKTTPFIVWNIIQKELNKRIQGTSKETPAHKYETYSMKELKTRISEFISLKQVEENDELLEIMYFLDKKSKIDEAVKKLSIQFIRLLDKLELQQTTAKKIIVNQTVKDLFDLMDKDLIKQQIVEELNKDFNAIINDFNSNDNSALADICSKYIAHNIDDEDKIKTMKEILNILSINDEKSARHKLVFYDTAKENSNDERIKEAQDIYGEDNQEKIGQYIIFNQVLKGEYTNADFNNDALEFADKLKDMHLNKDAIIKRLIELEDYFNSKEAGNNSLTNFIKHFNSNDNYINKLLTDFYIDNIYKDKITTIEVTADSKHFGGKNVTLIIFPEAKQAALENKEGNIDKYLFLIDSEEYAHNFANRKFGSLGIKIFTLDKSYQKEGFYEGDNVLEIKIPNGHNGARLAAKVKNENDRIFEIRYFMPKGFHKEKKRTDL